MNRSLALGAKVIPYVKELRAITGSVTGCILMQQMDYWFAQNPDRFYKFLEPCANPAYRAGDSWTEETGFSKDEFRCAFDTIGIRYASKTAYKEAEDKFQGLFYCSYHDKQKGVTFYFRNHTLLDAALDKLTKVESTVNRETQFTEVGKPDLCKSGNPISPILTENTSEITSNPESGNTEATPTATQKRPSANGDSGEAKTFSPSPSRANPIRPVNNPGVSTAALFDDADVSPPVARAVSSVGGTIAPKSAKNASQGRPSPENSHKNAAAQAAVAIWCAAYKSRYDVNPKPTGADCSHLSWLYKQLGEDDFMLLCKTWARSGDVFVMNSDHSISLLRTRYQAVLRQAKNPCPEKKPYKGAPKISTVKATPEEDAFVNAMNERAEQMYPAPPGGW